MDFELALVEMGRHHNTYLLQHDEEEDDSLETVAVSNWHYDTHLGINNEKEEVIGCIKPCQNRM